MLEKSKLEQNLAIEDNETEDAPLQFDPVYLIKELLSLGSSKITGGVAKQVALKVEKKLQVKKLPITPETISELVSEQLAHLELFDPDSIESAAQKIQTEKAHKTMLGLNDSFSEYTDQKIAHSVHPGKALKQSSWENEKLKTLFLKQGWETESKLLNHEFLLTLCRSIAQVDHLYSDSKIEAAELEDLSIDFHNLIASQDLVLGSYFFHADFLKEHAAKHAPLNQSFYSLNPLETFESLEEQVWEKKLKADTKKLLPYGYINLSKIIKDEEIDWDRLRKNTRLAIHFFDNLIDFWVYPNPEIEKTSKAERNVALGFMGWTDLLYLLRIPYESDEALCLASQIAQLITEESILASAQLAKDRGVYPAYSASESLALRHAKLNQIIEDEFSEQFSECTIGIKPYEKLVTLNTAESIPVIQWVHPFFSKVAKLRNINQERIFVKVAQQKSLSQIENIPEDIQKVFVTQKDIYWKNQILMAKEFERHFKSEIPLSFQNNFFESTELQKLLHFCVEQGLQTLKLNRNCFCERKQKSRHSQNLIHFQKEALTEVFQLNKNTQFMNFDIPIDVMVGNQHKKMPKTSFVTPVEIMTGLSKKAVRNKKEEAMSHSTFLNHSLHHNPYATKGKTYTYTTCCGKLWIRINHDDNGIFEVLTELEDPNQRCTSTQSVLINRFISLLFQAGVVLEEILAQLSDLSCCESLNKRPRTINCFEAISHAIRCHLEECENKIEDQWKQNYWDMPEECESLIDA